jgi:hypothetical protein
VSGRDITEGRSTRAIAVELGIATSTIWQNTGDAYDVAIGGVPFLLAVNDQHPYERATAPFRKQQFDSQRDPGEQSLTGWWLRSQSSFHAGEGVDFYDPLSNPYSTTLASNSYRYNASIGVDTTDNPGQVTLLRRPTRTQTTTSAYSIQTVTVSGNDRILVHENSTLKLTDGTTSAYTTLSSSVATTIYAATNDGLNAYYLDAANLVKVPLTGGATSSVRAITGTTNAKMAYVKQRLVVGINNKLYEFSANSAGPYTVTNSQIANKIATLTTSVNHSLRVGDSITVASIATSAASYNGSYVITAVTPNTISYYHDNVDRAYETQSAGTITLTTNTPIYTHPNSSWVWTSITESGAAIYASGFAGADSAVLKFTLDTTGAMPTINSGITAVAVPSGEIIHNIYVHLMSYIAMGTNKGLRIGTISDTTGDITYGPLMIKTERPVRGFAAHNSYIYAASSSNTELGGNYPMIYRVDLSNEIDNLRFAYQTDIYAEDTTGEAIDVCHLGRQDRLAFIAGTASNSVTTTGDKGLWVQSATEVYPSGYIQTGYIRYNTLEQKNFKRIVARGDYGVAPDRFTPAVTKGSMSISTRDLDNNLFDVVSYDNVIGTPESTITQPAGAQDALGLRFTLFRDATNTSVSPIFKGYQLKAVPASPRERIIKVPLMNFDTETDKYNASQGWEGRAIQRLKALESIESYGDVVTFQDFRTNETSQCLIEEVNFINNTPPDKKLTNFGGIILLTIRTV